MLESGSVRKGLKGLKLTVFLTFLVLPLFWGTALLQPASDGAKIFQEQCSGCHTIGGGDLIGPDLKGVAQQADPQWLTNFITNPGKMISAGDPVAKSLYQKYGSITMPTLGLSPDQVAAVIAYLGSTSSGTQAANTNPNVSLPAGDAVKGKSLFMGNSHFHNGGPPCMGCHNFGSNGILGGGTLGFDLTNAAAKYNDASLAAALANIPFPTMKPIFNKHPLTAEEQADLRAFILTSAGQHKTNKEAWVMGISLAGLAGVAVLLGLLYRRRLRLVRRSLVEQARSGK